MKDTDSVKTLKLPDSSKNTASWLGINNVEISDGLIDYLSACFFESFFIVGRAVDEARDLRFCSAMKNKNDMNNWLHIMK